MFWALLTAALAQQSGILTAEAEVVYFEPAGVGTSTPISVSFSASGDVTVTSVDIENTSGTAFRADGPPTLDVSSGSGTLDLLFAPSSVGQQSARVTIGSDAGCTIPQVVELRGSAYYPCIVISPQILDFGRVFVNDAEQITLNMRSCDGRNHTVNTALADNSRFDVGIPQPFTVTPAGINVAIQFLPTDDTPQAGVLTIGDWGSTVQMYGNDCYNGNPDNWDTDGDGISDCGIPAGGVWTDDDGDGWSEAEGDCNDSSSSVNPDAPEIDGAVDDNCNGTVDEHNDADGDGHAIPGDCDDTHAWIGTGEPEVFDGLDNDCDGEVDDGLEPQTCSSSLGDTGSSSGEKGCGCSQVDGSGPLGVSWVLAILLLGRRRAPRH